MARKREPLVQASVKMDPAQYEELGQVAKDRGFGSRALFIREAIRNELKREDVRLMEERLVKSLTALNKRLDKLQEANEALYQLVAHEAPRAVSVPERPVTPPGALTGDPNEGEYIAMVRKLTRWNGDRDEQ